MTFPRFTLRTDEDVPQEVLDRRARFAASQRARQAEDNDKPLGHILRDEYAKLQTRIVPTPEETAENFGREMFLLHGRRWPEMIALASGAAMKAEREVMGEVK